MKARILSKIRASTSLFELMECILLLEQYAFKVDQDFVDAVRDTIKTFIVVHG